MRSGATPPCGPPADGGTRIAAARLGPPGAPPTGGGVGAQSAPVLPISSRRSCSASLSSEARGRLTKIEIRLRSIR